MKVFLVSLLLTILAEWVGAQKPWYCGNFDCPDFTSDKSPGSYEIRTYGSTRWLATSVVSRNIDASMAQKINMFWKMFPYFNGQNSESTKIKMAVPALTKVHKRPDGQYNITMMFYVSQPNPPAPVSESVSLITRPVVEVFVKEFPMISIPSNQLVRRKVTELKNDIADNSFYDNDIFFSTSYNYPFNLKLKQYEVWVDKLV